MGKNYLYDYAIYKDDEFIFLGKVNECAERLGVKNETIRYYTSQAYSRKLEKRNSKNAFIVIKVEND